jgi:hypothetical protein
MSGEWFARLLKPAVQRCGCGTALPNAWNGPCNNCMNTDLETAVAKVVDGYTEDEWHKRAT